MSKIAFVCAGQGAQAPGMGRELYDASPAARAVFDAAEALRPGVTALCFDGPSEALNQTINTQPCLFVVDLAAARALREAGVEPQGAAGFSLGELVADTVAGMMDEAAAFRLVCARAEAMQACNEKHPGSMFAVLRLSDEQVESIAAAVGSAYPVNYNCPGQVVVACQTSVGPDLQQAVTAAGGKAIKLPVGGAFHSPLMDEAVVPLRAALAATTFAPMTIPVYANATAAVYDDPAELLARQVNHPVLWSQTIKTMIADGFDTFVEVGPGKTLSGFIRKTDPSVTVTNVADLDSLNQTLEVLAHGR
ncbi:MAG: ACP S-malonyltransferase [Propionibacteriaceae bacterium]|jgi:[acyl-carrier-protein] S-malonyltransferase|nr:ACP S-malonyltransferase [Propionibacteriaceae bacterium]